MISAFFFTFMASVFISFLFNVPKKSVLVTATIAGIGYVVFISFNNSPNTELLGYFIGTLVMAILSEIAARVMKMTTTIFITTAVIPLVPGLGLYQTMQFLVQNNYNAFMETGIHTMLAAGTIAMAIAIDTLFVKIFVRVWNKTQGDGSSVS